MLVVPGHCINPKYYSYISFSSKIDGIVVQCLNLKILTISNERILLVLNYEHLSPDSAVIMDKHRSDDAIGMS
jgi:hypothetical protein